MSRAVVRLETRLGVRLLERTTRSLLLTDEGGRFYAAAAPLLAHLSAAALALTSSRQAVRCRLRAEMDPIAVMARVLGVSESRFHTWRQRPASAHAVADAALLKRVRAVQASSRGTYGVPRVHAELRAGGEKHGRKRIARLMRGRVWWAPAAVAPE